MQTNCSCCSCRHYDGERMMKIYNSYRLFSLALCSSVAMADVIEDGPLLSVYVASAFQTHSVKGGGVDGSTCKDPPGIIGYSVGYTYNKMLKIKADGQSTLLSDNSYPAAYPSNALSPKLDTLNYEGDLKTRYSRTDVKIGVNLLRFAGMENTTLYLNSGAGFYSFINRFYGSGTYLQHLYWYVPIELEGEHAISSSWGLRYGAWYNIMLKGKQFNGRYKDLSSAKLDVSGSSEMGVKVGLSYLIAENNTAKYSPLLFADVFFDYQNIREKPQDLNSSFDNKGMRVGIMAGIKL